MNIIEIDGVSKSFANHKALSNVSMQIPEGSVFGLLGPNGAGKTTLIRIINQIYAPDCGTITFDGHPLTRTDVANMGYLPEERGLYKQMRVGEQAIYLAQLKGMSAAEARRRLHYWFDKFEISEWWNRKVDELSKGMQQKVQFITTVLHEPRLLVFDEPFSGFDPINANLLKNEILELRDKGATIIFSTHNMSSVEEVCNRVALINKSHKVLDGEVRSIKQQFKLNKFDLAFVGDYNLVASAIENMADAVEHNQQGADCEVSGRLKTGVTFNHLLQMLLPLVQITRFNELLPTMNDIFIETVNNSQSIGNE